MGHSHRHRRPREKERERYYLLPGMGGRSLRKKQWIMLKAGVGVGLVIAVIVGLLIYLIYSRDMNAK